MYVWHESYHYIDRGAGITTMIPSSKRNIHTRKGRNRCRKCRQGSRQPTFGYVHLFTAWQGPGKSGK